jgi:Fe/S biogenesis protein NfuA
MITVTEVAKKKFREAIEAEGHQGHGLRVIVNNAGTHQPEFALNFVGPDEVREDDQIDDLGEFKVDAPNAGIPRPSGPVAEAVQTVLQKKINPAIAAHGGQVSLVAVEDATACLRFGGGCQGCGMVNVTLKQGVEKTLFEDVPQITKVMDVTDHAAGTNPYYQPSK